MLTLRKCKLNFVGDQFSPLQIKNQDLVIQSNLSFIPLQNNSCVYCLLVNSASRLVCIDIDNHSNDVVIDDVLEHLQEYLNVSLEYQVLQEVIYIEKTKSNGLHLIFIATDEMLEILACEELTKRYKININTELNKNDIHIDMFYQHDNTAENLIFTYPLKRREKSYTPLSTTEIKEIDKSLFLEIMRYLHQFSIKPRDINKYIPLHRSTCESLYSVSFLLSSFENFIATQTLPVFLDVIRESNYSYWMKVLFICADLKLQAEFLSFSQSVPYSTNKACSFNASDVLDKYNAEEGKEHKISILTLSYWYYLLYEQEACTSIIAQVDRQLAEIKKNNNNATEIKKADLVLLTLDREIKKKKEFEDKNKTNSNSNSNSNDDNHTKIDEIDKDKEDAKKNLAWAELVLAFAEHHNSSYFLLAFKYYYSSGLLSDVLYSKYNAVHLAIIFVLSTFQDKLTFEVTSSFSINLRLYSFLFASSNSGKNTIAKSFDIVHKMSSASYASVQHMHYVHSNPSKRNFFQVVDEAMHDNIALIFAKDIKEDSKTQTKKMLLRLADANNYLSVYGSKASGSHPPFRLHYSFVAFSAFTDYPDELDLDGGGVTRTHIVHLEENSIANPVPSFDKYEIYSRKRVATRVYDRAFSESIIRNLEGEYRKIENNYNYCQTGEYRSAGELYVLRCEVDRKAVEATLTKEEKKKKDNNQSERDKIEKWCEFEHRAIVIYSSNLADHLHQLHLNNQDNKRLQSKLKEAQESVSKELFSQRDDYIVNKLLFALFLNVDTISRISIDNNNTTLDFVYNEESLIILYIKTLEMINRERFLFIEKAKEYRKQKFIKKASDMMMSKEVSSIEEQELRSLFLSYFAHKLNKTYYVSSCYNSARKLKKYFYGTTYEKEVKYLLTELENEKRIILEKDRVGKIIKFTFVN